jgi:hypothetical protein
VTEVSVDAALAQARDALARYGLLLLSDPALPSLVGIIVGEPLRASWWGHPRGGVIYQAMNALDDDPSVLSTKLVAGKVTYIHRRLWGAIVTLGTAREAWQLSGLSEGALWLLEHVAVEGEVQTDLVVPPPGVRMRKRVADAARELEQRLLVHASEVHTASGAHAKVLQPWATWAGAEGIDARGLTAGAARADLEAAASRLAEATAGGHAALPWQPTPRRNTQRVFGLDEV